MDAIVAVLSPHYLEGQRRSVALGFGGYAAKQGVRQEDAVAVIRTVAAGDIDGGAKSERRVTDSYATLAEGHDVAGYTLLRDTLPDDALDGLGRLIEPAEEWLDPLPLEASSPALLPVHKVPDVLRNQVLSVSRATQSARDMSVMLGLGSISVALRGLFVCDVRPFWAEEGIVQTVCVLDASARKSEPYRLILAPIADWEREDFAARAEETDRETVEHNRLTARLQAKIRDKKATRQDVQSARDDLREHKVPHARVLNAGSATPERLVGLLAENDGAIGVCGPEGDVFKIMAGQYSADGSPKLEVVKMGWKMEDHRAPRKLGDTYVRLPAVTICVCLQPSVIETIGPVPISWTVDGL